MEDDIFVKIYNKYLPYVYRYLYGLTYNHQTAEDLTQESFIKALCVLQFPSESIKSWLLTVAHNLYVDYVKKNRRLDFRKDSFLNQIKVQDFTEGLMINESTSSAFLLIRQLPENQRQAVLLCLVDELPYKQAGEILGISVSAVTNLIYRARKTLRVLRRNNNE
ncbi:RNA polymerase sigma factor [Clostridium sp.]|uniref:RNA polymerase sigma factor n=1 Tax=Clostridium sp. TaxID=1506 RepID=UPI001A61F606|nr:RNA polymerase sigma factor [Clostridium sp.]MBK5243257.1 RNA polymerase sigma factor [Clostridium sp.]